MAADRILLVDGHSMAYRAFYALPPENFATSTGQPTNAVYGFTSMLINVLRDEKPSFVAVAFDVSRVSFRTEMFPEYKATRAKSPEEFKGQVELIADVVEALGIPVFRKEGFEADDLIATLATQAHEQGIEVQIITGDRDTFQLVDEQTTVLYPRKGVSDLARMTPASIEEKYGVTPTQYADLAALRGDSSDNLPGIPGVGEKTAQKWITTYGSLAGIVDNADEIAGKVGDALRSSLSQVLVNRELTALVRDVPLERGVAECRWNGWNPAEVDAVFTALQFNALRPRLKDLPSSTPASPAARAEHTSVKEMQVRVIEAHDVVATLASLPVDVAVACAGEWGAGTGNIAAAAVASESDVVVILCDTPELVRAFMQWCSDPATRKVMHDAKGPALALLTHGYELAGVIWDTALAAYVLEPGQRSYALTDVAMRDLGVVIDDPHTGMGQLDLLDDSSGIDPELLAREARTIWSLRQDQQPRIERDGLGDLLVTVEIPTTLLLARMEHAGIAVDKKALVDLSEPFARDLKDYENDAFAIVGHTFNLGSPKQLQEILFVERELPKTKKIKTGYTTDAEALNDLFERTHDPLLEKILAWRDRSKLRQTVDGLLPLIAQDGRVHTTFKQTVAATGRLSSADPNLQNIPVRTEEGRLIRGAFVVGEGYATLLTADYSQIELRIMAHVSNDVGLIEAFASGEDLHNTVASAVFGVAPDRVDAEMRRQIKAMSYGLAYGLSAFGLAQQLRISPGEAQALMDEYFTRFGGIRDYLADVVNKARTTGYTETMFGRRRYLPDLQHDNRQRRDMAERMALNAPIQGTAADIVKLAMLHVDHRLRREGLGSRLLLQVHDELVLEVAPGEEERVEALVREEMAGAAELRVPLDVSVGVGRSWQDAAH